MSGAETAQEAEVTVKATVTRLVPCQAHTGGGTGEHILDGAGRPLQNPNGYRHDCADCRDTPTHTEIIDVPQGGVTING